MHCYVSSLKSAKVSGEWELLVLGGSEENYIEREAGVCPGPPRLLPSLQTSLPHWQYQISLLAY